MFPVGSLAANREDVPVVGRRQRLVDEFVARLPLTAKRELLYRRMHGRRPGRPPERFSEKINWRIVHDRRPVIARLGDKLAMKEYATGVCPDLRVPQVLWTGTDLADLPADLPERWVLKPNHGTMRVHIVVGDPDLPRLRQVSTGWLDEPLYRLRGEWVYSQARRLLLAEEFLGRPGTLPVDHKFLVFGGRVRLVQVDSGRLTPDHTRQLYTPEWEPFDTAEHGAAQGVVTAAPAALPEMLAVATALGRAFDFIRVDLYDVDGVVWFSELTPYPGAGLVRYDPAFDRLLGSWWELPPRREVRARARGEGRGSGGLGGDISRGGAPGRRTAPG